MRQETVRTNGVDLATEVHGDPSDPAVLLLHGAGQCLVSWPDDLVRMLVDARRCVVRYDSRDAGISTMFPAGEPGYGLPDVVADASGLLLALGIDRAHLVGVSGGTAVAQLMALDHPEQVASLTLMEGTPGGPGHETPDLPPMTSELLALFSEEQPIPDLSDRVAAVEYLVDAERPFAATSRPFDEAGVRAIAERVAEHAADLETMMANAFLADPGPPWRERLPDIEVPTLVLHGTEDPLFPIEHGRALAAEIPSARLIELPQTGHEIVPRHLWDRVVPEIVAHTRP
ncbi:alpha/beta fold hydrolase [Microbacterium karelineae]|uniref:alpha/beta fold hydrolase n=1 Tax=Microbacterium karelineae TaxID=2654283 RepID=UPI0012EA3887|nr:alpha/beta hydrolase [Microbacterium karelineae]